MGERQNGLFQLSFNSSLKVDFQGSRVTSDGGLILVRELDERLGFGDLVAQHLTDSRRGKNTQLPLATVGAAQEDRRLVVDQLAAAVSEDGWPIDQAHPLRLAATGREPSDSATVWEHSPADRLADLARRVGEPQNGADFSGEVGRGGKGV